MAAQGFKLSAEQVTSLRSVQDHLNAAKDTIDRLKRIGIDVSAHEDALNEAIQTRDGLLREFAPTGVPRQP